MNWFNNYRKFAITIGLTLLVPVFVLLYISTDLWMLRQSSQGEINRLKPRIARMIGLMESESQLQASAGQLGSHVLNLVYPPTEGAAGVSASLQKNIREIMADAGLAVSNSRILPLIQEENFDRIGLSLTVSGSLGALDAALLQLEAYTPLVLIESIDIKPKRTRRSSKSKQEQIVTASLQLLTLRAL